MKTSLPIMASLDSRNNILWIYLPVVLVVIVNLILLIIYQQSHQTKSLEENVWNYLETSVFQGLTASLLFPIFLSLLERRFRIIEKEIEDRKERQYETIRDSSLKWNEFYSIVNKVIFFKLSNSNHNINDILKSLDDSKSKTIDLITMCKARFPYLTSREIDMIIHFDNILYSATKSVGNFIKVEQESHEIAKLQNCLGMIQRVVGNYGHYYGLQVMLLIIESQKIQISAKQRENIYIEIQKLLNIMEQSIRELNKLEGQGNRLLSTIKGDKIENFRNKSDLIYHWMKQNPNTGIDSVQFNEYKNSQDYKDFSRLFFEIPIEERADAERFPYSKEYIFLLANYLSLSTIIVNMRGKTSMQNNNSNG